MIKFSLTIVFLASISANAMEYSDVKLSVWSKGESIFGEEFIAFNESVVDYIATLPRPNSPTLNPNRFNCQAKIRFIRPDVSTIGSTNPAFHGYVEIRTVYDLKNCTPTD